MNKITVEDIRPQEIIRAYWAEQVVIEEQAKFLEPVYFWEVTPQEGK